MHAGVEVYGTEYAYGGASWLCVPGLNFSHLLHGVSMGPHVSLRHFAAGHEFDYTGVFATSPKDPPGQVVFRESIYMGETDLTQEEVQQLVYKMGYEYKVKAE